MRKRRKEGEESLERNLAHAPTTSSARVRDERDCEESDTDEEDSIVQAVNELRGFIDRGMKQIIDLLKDIKEGQQSTNRSIVALSETTITTHLRIEALQKKKEKEDDKRGDTS